MGQVFSFPEVRDRRVPSKNAFHEVVTDLRQWLPKVPGMIGGILIGSVLTGCHNERSDIDCFVLYDPEERARTLHGLTTLRDTASQRHVPLEFSPVDKVLARTDGHSVEWGFYHCMRNAVENGGVIGKNPLEHLFTKHLSPESDFMAYVRYKQRMRDRSGITSSKRRDAHELKRSLGLPLHLARKTLSLLGIPYQDNRAGILRAYRASEKLAAHVPLLEQIVMIDYEYTGHLRAHLNHPREHEYTKVLENLAQIHDYTDRFLRETLLLVLSPK